MNYNELAKTYKVTSSVIEETYNTIMADLADKGLTGTDLETETVELVHHTLRTLTARSKGELFTGMVLAIDKIKDGANPRGKPSKRQLYVDAYVANPEDTVAAGKIAVLGLDDGGNTTRTMKDRKTGGVKTEIVSPDIWKDYIITVNNRRLVPLDDTKLWTNGKENLSYLRNLPIHQYRTTVVIALKTDKGYTLAELDYNSEKLPGVIPMFVPVEFVATLKEDKDGIRHLGTSKFTTFEVSEEEFGITPMELLAGLLSEIKYPISKLMDYNTAMVKAGKKWDTLVMVEAWVSDIRGLDKDSPYLLINDNSTPKEDPLLRVFLHDGITINFGINSKIYVVGRTSQSDAWDADTGTVMKGVPGPITIFAMGVFCKYNTRPANIRPVREIDL